MNRRGFLGSILAAGVAPFIGKVEWLMPVRKVWTRLGSGLYVSLHTADPGDLLEHEASYGAYKRIEIPGGFEEVMKGADILFPMAVGGTSIVTHFAMYDKYGRVMVGRLNPTFICSGVQTSLRCQQSFD